MTVHVVTTSNNLKSKFNRPHCTRPVREREWRKGGGEPNGRMPASGRASGRGRKLREEGEWHGGKEGERALEEERELFAVAVGKPLRSG